MRVISLSVDGIQQAAERGLYQWLTTQEADVICLQDLRVLEPELDSPTFHLEGYFPYFFDSGVKGWNGVAVYTRHVPKALIYGLGFSSGLDMQGRYLQIDFNHHSFGSLLAPSALNANESLEDKIRFFDDLQALMHKVTRKRRNFIYCGNWGMAHTAKDLQQPVSNEHSVGFLAHERQWLDQAFNEVGYKDAFRIANKDNDEFSWFVDNDANNGWRTDFHIISDALQHHVEHASLYKSQTFSSHRPVIIDYDIDPERL